VQGARHNNNNINQITGKLFWSNKTKTKTKKKRKTFAQPKGVDLRESSGV
jgi:hypothetical protein